MSWAKAGQELAHLNYLAVLSVVVYNRHRGLDEGSLIISPDPFMGDLTGLTEPLLDRLSIIVISSTSLAPLHQSLEHDLLGGRDEKYKCRCTNLSSVSPSSELR